MKQNRAKTLLVQTLPVEYIPPLTGAEIIAEMDKLRQEMDERHAALQAQIAEQEGDQAQQEELVAQMDAITTEAESKLASLAETLEEEREKAKVVLMFRVASKRQEIAYNGAFFEVRDWEREKRLAVWKNGHESGEVEEVESLEAEDVPTDEELADVELDIMTVAEINYLVMACALQAAVVPAQCHNITVPEDLEDWIDALPADIFDDACEVVWTLNPSWRPTWHRAREEEGKNA